MNNTGVTGLTAKKKTLSMRVFGPRNSAYFDIRDIPTTYIYISREISIEHPSVGLASLAQLVASVRLGCSNSSLLFTMNQ